MLEDRRVIFAGAAGIALIVAAVVSDLVSAGFWERHALVTSILANVLVLAVTLAVVNELLERRDRRRWQLLAQHVLFGLVQAARATWTGMLELLRLGKVESGSLQPIINAAELARDLPRVSQAADELLADSERRINLRRVCGALGDHSYDLIAKWAPVMVGARPYAEVLNRHVELAERLATLHSLLAHAEPEETRDPRERVLARSNVATERAEEFGTDASLHAQILAVIRLATELDYESHEHGFALASMDWWQERTEGLAEGDPAGAAPLGPA